MRAILLSLALASTFESASAESQKVAAQFNVLDYNQISSEYLPVPTFVTLSTMKKGDAQMTVEFDPYGIDEYGMDTDFLNLRRSAIPEYRAFLAKYLEWEELARADGDQIRKVIGKAEGVRGKLQFQFESVSATKHLLVVTFCTFGACLGDPAIFDREGVIGLDAMLSDFEENGVQPVDVDEKYR